MGIAWVYMCTCWWKTTRQCLPCDNDTVTANPVCYMLFERLVGFKILTSVYLGLWLVWSGPREEASFWVLLLPHRAEQCPSVVAGGLSRVSPSPPPWMSCYLFYVAGISPTPVKLSLGNLPSCFESWDSSFPFYAMQTVGIADNIVAPSNHQHLAPKNPIADYFSTCLAGKSSTVQGEPPRGSSQLNWADNVCASWT